MSNFYEKLLTKAEGKTGKKASFFALESNINSHDVHLRDEGADSCELIATYYNGIKRYMVIHHHEAIIIDDLDIALEIAKNCVNNLEYTI